MIFISAVPVLLLLFFLLSGPSVFFHHLISTHHATISIHGNICFIFVLLSRLVVVDGNNVVWVTRRKGRGAMVVVVHG
jgi:hypothetical protein